MTVIFWTSLAALLYTYAVYPIAIWLLALIRNRTVAKLNVPKSDEPPSVSVVLACHNEASRIEARLRNLIQANYPKNRIEIIVAVDRSSDQTEAIARRFESNNMRVIDCGERLGKAGALNLGVQAATREIVVFADARQSFEADAIAELVANFADERVGAVSGELFIAADSKSGVSEGAGLYWNYEKWIRKSESRFDSTIGATGALFAIRRSLWRPLPPSTILDDVYTPMSIALRGYRIVFEEKARAHDVAASTPAQEFRRKARTLMGNYQLCQLEPRLLTPSYRLWIQFCSHKLMRLTTPIFMLLLLASNAALLIETSGAAGLYLAFAAAQVLFYSSVILGSQLSRHDRKIRVFNTAYLFSVMNAAALVGLFYFIRGKRDVWVRSK